MFTNIMVAVDLTDEHSWRRAVPEAVALVRASGAKLHLVTVVPDFGMTMVAQFFPEGYEEEALKQAQRDLHALSEREVPKDVEVQHHIVHGTIYEEIVKAATRHGIDLIVMAAYRQELKDYLLGPNTARVVRHAECSVMVIRN